MEGTMMLRPLHHRRFPTLTRLAIAAASFTGETATGWQQVNFATPISITANTTYLASYPAPPRHSSDLDGYFALAGRDNAPLHALGNGVDGANGVYRYGAVAFPATASASTNYWVDVVFTPTADTTPPTVTSTSPTSNATSVPTNAKVTATFSEDVQPTTIT